MRSDKKLKAIKSSLRADRPFPYSVYGRRDYLVSLKTTAAAFKSQIFNFFELCTFTLWSSCRHPHGFTVSPLKRSSISVMGSLDSSCHLRFNHILWALGFKTNRRMGANVFTVRGCFYFRLLLLNRMGFRKCIFFLSGKNRYNK